MLNIVPSVLFGSRQVQAKNQHGKLNPSFDLHDMISPLFMRGWYLLVFCACHLVLYCTKPWDLRLWDVGPGPHQPAAIQLSKILVRAIYLAATPNFQRVILVKNVVC